MARYLMLLVILLSVTMTLTGCFADKTEYVQTRLDKAPGDTRGILRPAKRQDILVMVDQGPNKEVKAGKLQGGIGPEYLLMFETDFVKMINTAKAYNQIVKNIAKAVEDKSITAEQAQTLLRINVE